MAEPIFHHPKKRAENIGWWVWCDIDGRGVKWRLVIPRAASGEPGNGPDNFYFPIEDFEDDPECYCDCPRRNIARPTDKP